MRDGLVYPLAKSGKNLKHHLKSVEWGRVDNSNKGEFIVWILEHTLHSVRFRFFMESRKPNKFDTIQILTLLFQWSTAAPF